MIKKALFSLFLLSFASNLYSANEKFFLTGYVDTYYTSDNLDKEFPLFSSINHQREKFSLNIAYLLFQYKDDNYRLKLGLQEGDIPKNIYFEEPKNIQQANIGVRLADGLWLDAGIMSTHIGGEITHPRMNYFSTHSAITFFEPTYQAGVKLSYNFNDNWYADLQLINGNHLFGDNNEQKTLAYTLGYESDYFSAFYAGMAGNEEPGGAEPQMHTYHNLFCRVKLTDNLELKAQTDFASKERTEALKKLTKDDIAWFLGAFIQSQYKFNEKFSVSARYSFYSDAEGTYNLNVEGYDISLATEYKPIENSYIRLESRFLKNTLGRNMFSFERNGKNVNEFVELSVNFGLWFDLKM